MIELHDTSFFWWVKFNLSRDHVHSIGISKDQTTDFGYKLCWLKFAGDDFE